MIDETDLTSYPVHYKECLIIITPDPGKGGKLTKVNLYVYDEADKTNEIYCELFVETKESRTEIESRLRKWIDDHRAAQLG